MEVVNDVDKAILVMRDAGKWMVDSGIAPSKWWDLPNLNKEFLFQYAKAEEFYVCLVNHEPAAAAILQFSQNAQDWEKIDKDKKIPALYIHWLCVMRKFAGKNFTKSIIDFASEMAKKKKIKYLRVDTNAEEEKLRNLYENLGFKLQEIIKEDYRTTAFYEKEV